MEPLPLVHVTVILRHLAPITSRVTGVCDAAYFHSNRPLIRYCVNRQHASCQSTSTVTLSTLRTSAARVGVARFTCVPWMSLNGPRRRGVSCWSTSYDLHPKIGTIVTVTPTCPGAGETEKHALIRSKHDVVARVPPTLLTSSLSLSILKNGLPSLASQSDLRNPCPFLPSL